MTRADQLTVTDYENTSHGLQVMAHIYEVSNT